MAQILLGALSTQSCNCLSCTSTSFSYQAHNRELQPLQYPWPKGIEWTKLLSPSAEADSAPSTRKLDSYCVDSGHTWVTHFWCLPTMSWLQNVNRCICDQHQCRLNSVCNHLMLYAHSSIWNLHQSRPNWVCNHIMLYAHSWIWNLHQHKEWAPSYSYKFLELPSNSLFYHRVMQNHRLMWRYWCV